MEGPSPKHGIDSRAAVRTSVEQSIVAVSATTSTPVLARNGMRCYLVVQNQTAGILYLRVDDAEATTNDLRIPAGAEYTPRPCPVGAISAIATTAGNVVVLEGI